MSLANPNMQSIPHFDDATRRMIDDIRACKNVSDKQFDQLFPEPIRRVSSKFWTPIIVAQKAAKILAAGVGPILDVGAGVGKFCIIGALTTEATFHGVEHRLELVEIANVVAQALGVSHRVRIVHGNLDDVEWPMYSSFYFCNPFEENIFPPDLRFDHQVPLSKTKFHQDTQRIESVLAAAPLHSRVVTFHGLGARFPPTFRRWPEPTHGNPLLHCWIKVQERTAEGNGTFDGWIDERSLSTE